MCLFLHKIMKRKDEMCYLLGLITFWCSCLWQLISGLEFLIKTLWCGVFLDVFLLMLFGYHDTMNIDVFRLLFCCVAGWMWWSL